MRIWIINHYAAPPSMPGGTRHYSFAKELIKRGHQVTLFAANYNHFTHCHIDSHQMKTLSQDVPFIWIPTPPYKGNTIARFWNMLVFSFRVLQKKFVRHTEPPDIIIGSSPHLFAAFSAYLLAKKYHVPFIFEVRDLWPETLIDLGRISRHHPLIVLMRWIEKFLYKKAHHLITLLPSADTYLIAQGVSKNRISWLPNSIDTDVMPNNISSIPYASQQNEFVIMYAGAHGLANDLETVLYAANILQEKYQSHCIRIILVGDGPTKPVLKKLADELQLSMITFQDAVPKKQIYTELQKADAFFILLKKSPLFRWGISPNKLFDYLVMEKPIIFGIDTPFNPIEQYQAGISVPPGDPEALAKAMFELSQLSKKERQEMGIRGKQFVLEHHHIQRVTDSLEKILQN